MSAYMEIVEADDANPNTIKEPAKRWQNWYHSKRDAVFANGYVNKAGWWPSPNVWPSREVAEAKARDHNIKFRGWMREYQIQWGGAFPEGERP